MMNLLLRLAAAPALVLCLALPGHAAGLSLDAISAYLNTLTSVQAPFTQVNADGTTAKGRILIKRPGRARFEYAGDDTLVLASGGQVAIFDPKSNQQVTQYPLSRTPLNLILAQTVDLSRARMVVGQSGDAKTTTVVAQDPDHPEYGTISLVFDNAPVALRRWTITDQTGAKTVVVLGDLGVDPSIPPSLFSISAEIEARKR